MSKKLDVITGTSLWDWLLAALFGTYIGLVGGFGILYLVKRRREKIDPTLDY
jgi:hypothetical protein